jgi:hypothetical protein
MQGKYGDLNARKKSIIPLSSTVYNAAKKNEKYAEWQQTTNYDERTKFGSTFHR